MTADDWVPFGLTEDERQDYAVLRDGLPGPMREQVLAWIIGRVLRDVTWAHIPPLLEAQTACRVDLGVQAASLGYVQNAQVLAAMRQQSDVHLLRLADFFAARASSKYGDLAGLDALLTQGRSRWRVGERFGKPGLVERVPSGVQDAAEGVINTSATSGEVLRRAWSEVHGLEPRDSSAYSYAVRAVEIAATATVMPRKADATLGNVIGQMRADGDWRLPFREHADAPSAAVVLGMLRTLWVGHRDRHGSADYSDVTHDEARAAVILAATLVDWFTSAAVQRRPE